MGSYLRPYVKHGIAPFFTKITKLYVENSLTKLLFLNPIKNAENATFNLHASFHSTTESIYRYDYIPTTFVTA
jgi:hypothetical protein